MQREGDEKRQKNLFEQRIAQLNEELGTAKVALQKNSAALASAEQAQSKRPPSAKPSLLKSRSCARMQSDTKRSHLLMN